jgi:hypothetical protein
MYGRYAGSPQFIVMFAWMSIESLVYCSKLRKRHALGHFEPIIVNRLAARGTLRLALKQGGLAPSSVIGSELAVVVRPILPDELSLRTSPIRAPSAIA